MFFIFIFREWPEEDEDGLTTDGGQDRTEPYPTAVDAQHGCTTRQ